MARKKKKKTSVDANKILLYTLGIIIFLLFFSFYSEQNDLHLSYATNEILVEEVNTVTPIETEGTGLKIYFFDVGQADCILVSTGEENMLIDAGNNSDGKLIANYLKDTLKISTLDYAIGTHNHEDHIGGLDDVIKAIDVKNLYLPFVSVTSTKTYENVENAALKKNIDIINPNVGDKFKLGTAELEIMSINNDEPKNKNEESIMIQMQFGSLKYLFTGDAEVENENSRQWDDIDVLKVGHHGSNTSSGEKFLSQIKPEIAIVSVGPNNSYNLPKSAILERIQKYGATIYRTDELGTIILTSDGTTNEITNSKEICLDGNSR